MKIKFNQNPPGGRPEYKKGDVVEVEESYAKKYIARGWAEPADKAAQAAADEVKQKAKTDAARVADEAKQNADYKSQVESGQRGPSMQVSGQDKK